jgi:hypothetical protein
MLMIDAGTKNGEMRRGPRLTIFACVCSIIGSPPMPEPMFTPTRVASSSPSASPVGSPLSAMACDGRGQPEVDEAVHVPGFLLGDVVADVEALDLAGEPAARLAGSNWVMWSMPGLPASRLAQDSATVLPTGLTQPRPVTTTRRRCIPGQAFWWAFA